MSHKNEMMLERFSKPITYEKTKLILKQMESCICRIKINDKKGTGTFCKIPFPDKNNLLPVLITNNHVIDENIINSEKENLIIFIKSENKNRQLELKDRIIYTNKEYDITFIEIKPNKDGIQNFLEIDDNIINDGFIGGYIHESIYILQYPKEVLSVSYGILENIEINKNYIFRHLCNTDECSSGGAVINARNNKLIGIHKGAENKDNEYNIGIFFHYAMKNCYYNKLLDEFNKKFNTKLNFDIVESDLVDKKIGNDDLKILNQFKFNKMKTLNLKSNNITEINSFEKSNLQNLEILNLNYNNISNINVLEKAFLPKLTQLHLFSNNISSINALSNVIFEKLEKLDLGKNKISDISILEKVKFKELKMLNLYKNNISDINVLDKVNFEKLEILNLGCNHITNIDVLSKVNFKELKGLCLRKNKITDIKVLKDVKFEILEELNLENNNIFDINIFKETNFKELKGISLSNNNISDIKVFNLMKFGKLEIIDLKGNKIDKELNSYVIQYLKEKLDKFII